MPIHLCKDACSNKSDKPLTIKFGQLAKPYGHRWFKVFGRLFKNMLCYGYIIRFTEIMLSKILLLSENNLQTNLSSEGK